MPGLVDQPWNLMYRIIFLDPITKLPGKCTVTDLKCFGSKTLGKGLKLLTTKKLWCNLLGIHRDELVS